MKNTISIKEYGKTAAGADVSLFIITCDKLEVGLINYGASIAYLKVPDKKSTVDDIVTGFESLPGKGSFTFFYCIMLMQKCM